MVNKKNLVFLSLFSLVFLFSLNLASSTYYDYEIDSDSSTLCLLPDTTYLFNVSNFYDFSDGAIGSGEISLESSHRWDIKHRSWGSTILEHVYVDEQYCYQSIPYNDSYMTFLTCGDEVYIQTSDPYTLATSDFNLKIRNIK